MFYILILWYWHNLYIFAKAHELNILKSESFIVCRLCLEINRLKKKERNCAPDEENPSSITMGFRTTQPLSKLGRLLPKQEAASTQPAMSTSSAMVHTTKLYAYHLFLCSLTHFQITVEKPISQQESQPYWNLSNVFSFSLFFFFLAIHIPSYIQGILNGSWNQKRMSHFTVSRTVPQFQVVTSQFLPRFSHVVYFFPSHFGSLPCCLLLTVQSFFLFIWILIFPNLAPVLLSDSTVLRLREAGLLTSQEPACFGVSF